MSSEFNPNISVTSPELGNVRPYLSVFYHSDESSTNVVLKGYIAVASLSVPNGNDFSFGQPSSLTNFASWARQRTFNAFAFLQTRVKRAYVYVSLFCPVCKAVGFVLYRKQNIDTFVSRLLCGRCPVTIVRRVARVVILTLNGMVPGGAFSHIRVEVNKRITPPLTNRNTTPAVGRVFRGRRIVASVFNRAPSAILSRVRKSVGAVTGTGYRRPQAPAAFRVPTEKATTGRRGRCSAFTFTSPVYQLVLFANEVKANYLKKTKLPAYKFFSGVTFTHAYQPPKFRELLNWRNYNTGDYDFPV